MWVYRPPNSRIAISSVGATKDDFGTFGHRSSTSTVAFDWQGMTSYWCSIVTIRDLRSVGGTVAEFLSEYKVRRVVIAVILQA